jgi:hypothetical protein
LDGAADALARTDDSCAANCGTNDGADRIPHICTDSQADYSTDG